MRNCLFLSVILLLAGNSFAQSNKADAAYEERIRAASQAGASPLFFNPAAADIPIIAPLEFDNGRECTVRNGLPNFFHNAATGKPMTMGFIGGSITQAVYGYRTRAARYIQSLYPNTPMKAINAGISGTGTDLGACRLHEQLLQYHPDIIFVEFAVNGAYREGMEGIIRQIWEFDPAIEICLLYTIHHEQHAIYTAGRVPDNIRGLEELADYYGIPSIHLGIQPASMVQEGKLVWRSDSKTIPAKIVFSNDGAHPLPEGGDLYAGAIARSLITLQKNTRSRKHVLPAPLLADNWDNAHMYAPAELAVFSSGWNRINPNDSTFLKQFAPWFPYIMKSEQPGASLTFRFKGNMFGFFDIGGPEAGQLTIEVDGKMVKLSLVLPGTRIATISDTAGMSLVNRFNNFCNNRYRGQFECIKVLYGEHTVTIKLSPEKADKRKVLGENQLADITANPAKYDRTVVYLGKILVRGEILSK
ncbi:SGNH/GDSL hydrolase family protein [Paraflavitalea speifideaquila]|uniref:SGNH/GDSL hydrolase family protein n=1 Tax=Paraflavitalea speifideaquila TaxID=3076558 RepID=UPI0028ED625E|nr:SGNH/GDSL hydrolase family protein [Paraflavitalea speifideiaquila]